MEIIGNRRKKNILKTRKTKLKKFSLTTLTVQKTPNCKSMLEICLRIPSVYYFVLGIMTLCQHSKYLSSFSKTFNGYWHSYVIQGDQGNRFFVVLTLIIRKKCFTANIVQVLRILLIYHILLFETFGGFINNKKIPLLPHFNKYAYVYTGSAVRN